MKCPKCFSDNPDTKQFCADCGTQLSPAQGKAEAQALHTKTIETPVEEITRGTMFAGRYEVIEELGRGGMGRVYRVEDKKVGQEVALKLIKPEIASDAKTLQRFRHELKTARMISHKSVCRMFDLGEAQGAYYITMEYVPGENLKSLIRQVGRLDTDTAVKMAHQICEGLAEAHRLGVVHRDLKPGNIMIDREGSVRIMDFGIARSLKAKGLTGTGIVIGTPEYMSPEQAEAKGVDQSSDLYSLGVVLFEMVTGRLPFEGDTPLSIAMKHKGAEPEAPSTFNPQIPDGLNRLILKCLAKDKADRYESAEEMVAELVDIKSGFPTTESDKTLGRTARKVVGKTEGKKSTTSKEITLSLTPKKFVGAAVAAGLVIVALVVVLLWRPWSTQTPAAAAKIKNSIAVIGFENQTGNSAYDHLQKVFPNLLITNLEATGLFHVLTWERMRDISRQIGEERGDIIDRDLGFEICRREGIEALVIGSYTKLGEMFATDIKVYDVDTKNSLSSASSSGEGEQSILENQIDDLSREIVASRGEVLGEKASAAATHISEVTTSSLEAYNYYLRGVELSYMLYVEDARQTLEKAVEIDPTFASAYLELSHVYMELEDSKASTEALRTAREYSDRVTEKERLFIEATYVSLIEMDREKSVSLYETLIAKFPREKRAYFWLGIAHYFTRSLDEAIEAFKRALELDPRYGDCVNMIAYAYLESGDYPQAVEFFQQYAALSPGQANPHDSLADAYMLTGRLDEALAEFKEALRIKPDFGSQWKMAYVYALKENYTEAQQWIDDFIDTATGPGMKALGQFWRAFYLYWQGDLGGSFDELRQAEALAKSVENEMMLGRIDRLKGRIYYERGESELSRETYKTLTENLHKNFPVLSSFYDSLYFFDLGMLDLKLGRVEAARSQVERIGALLDNVEPSDRDWVMYYRDFLHAEILLAEESFEEAVTVGKGISGLEYPRSLTPAAGITYNLPPCKDVLARAYVAADRVDEAVAEYKKMVEFDPDDPVLYLIPPVYHYRLGVLYEQVGRVDKAKEQYERFLELGKGADPELEEVKDARRRLMALRQTQPKQNK
jgi:serine/threonine protein kinase/Tfp pilus assembly protein PilF